MKKRVLIFVVLFLFALVLININLGLSEELESKSLIIKSGSIEKIITEKYDSLDDTDKIKIIVKPRKDYSNLRLSSAGLSREIIDSYNGYELREVTKGEYELMKLDNSFEYIGLSRKIHAFLQQSIPLINGTITHPLQATGLNFTGQGETVCIIDTGIDFTHPALIGKNKTCVIDCYNKECVENCSIGDDNGHGTHCAGIVAASSTITGVAPNASLIGLKVLNSNGDGGNDLDLNRAIDWCVANKDNYNISVISMSLGTASLYTDYCDNPSDPWTISINNATLYNISVISASGNDKNLTAIAAPACIQNSTAVGMTYDTDYGSASWSSGGSPICSDNPANANVLVCWGNRNSLIDLIAPGAIINSTYPSLTYYSTQGTSMATPHVAGAIAVIKQVLKLTGKTKTPQEIESILNQTGKQISDSSTGLTFSRIDLYSAILSLDESSPNTTLVSPLNSSSTGIINQTFTANITDDLQLKNTTFYLWNSTSLVYFNFSFLSDINQQVLFNVTNLDYTTYTWDFYSCDIDDNCSFSQSNYSLFISSLVSNILTPENNTRTKQTQTNFTCNITSTQDFPLVNNTFLLWNSTSLVYSETKNFTGTANFSIFNISLSSFGDNTYYWNCLSTNNASLSDYSDSNFTITYDSTPPELNITFPINRTWYNSLKFNISVNEESDSCWFSLNNQNNLTMNKTNSTYFYYSNSSTQTEVIDRNNITFYCNDTASNLNYSQLIFFGIDLIKPNITIISPANSYSETTSSTSINFQFNVSDNLNISECKLIISGSSGSITANTSTITNTTNTIAKTLSSGSYSWHINCTDEVGNQENSSLRTITLTAPSTSSGSGGGGSTTPKVKTYTLADTQIIQGYNQILGVKDTINFNISNHSHRLLVDILSANFTTLLVYSNPINITMSLGEEKKLNLTSSELYDLYVKLNSISGDKANLTIKQINESTIFRISPSGEIIPNKELQDKIRFNLWAIGLIILISLFIVWIIVRQIRIFRLAKKNKQNDKTKQKIKTKK